MDPFLAEIRIFAGNFAPRGWALCNGQILPIQQNTALFSLIGTYYGGNGQTNFGLPNFQGRVGLNRGNGPGLTPRVLGEQGGEEAVTLLTQQLPAHTHVAQGATVAGNTGDPSGAVWAKGVTGGQGQTSAVALYSAAPASTAQMSPNTLNFTGGSQPHNNMMPYQVLNFIIALQGIYPSRP